MATTQVPTTVGEAMDAARKRERRVAENVAELSWSLAGDRTFEKYFNEVRAELGAETSPRDAVRDAVIEFATLLADIEEERPELYGAEGADWFITIDNIALEILRDVLYTASRVVVERAIERSKS